MNVKEVSREEKAGLELVGSVWPVSRETSQRLIEYVALLRQWQPRINLVAPSTMDDIWTRHIADSVQTFALRSKAKNWIDIGSGAGFPGLVVAILLAEKGAGKVELVESNGKKCAFLNAVTRETGLRESGVEVIVHKGRIESVLPTLDRPDIVSARALASLNDLLGLTESYLQGDCVGLFSKGRDHSLEIEEARADWSFDLEKTDSRFGENSVLLQVKNVSRRVVSNA